MLLRIERYIFYTFLFAIPFQTRKILWYSGWRFNEWQSVSVYATDILLITLFLVWLFRSLYETPKTQNTEPKAQIRSKFKNPDFYLFMFVVVSAVSIKNSTDIAISWFRWVKLLEFSLFYLYLKNYAVYKFGFTNSLFAIFCGGFFQGVVAIGQFLKQSSLGLGYLGESIFDLDMRGIASFYNIFGEKVIRAYGTTSHSNILAAYLFLAIFAFYFIWLYKKSKYENFLFYAHLLVLWGFFYTFARVSAFALGANYLVRGCLSTLKFRDSLKKPKLFRLVFFTGAVAILFTVLYWPEVLSRVSISGDEDAVQLRNFYSRESLKIVSLTGIGIGNFVNELAARDPYLPHYLLQPVHNIYLLIYSETGILSISAFILFLIFLVKDFVIRTKMERFHHYSLILLFSSFLFMGFFDHFFWTLQPGGLLFWLTLAALAADESDDING